MDVDIRKPTVTATLAELGDCQVEEVTVYMTVGSAPTASIKVHFAQGGEQVEYISSKDVADKIGRLQEKFFAPKTGSGDSSLIINDGSGNSLNFRGFITGAGNALMVRGVGLNFHMIHESGRIGALRTNIYTEGNDPNIRDDPDNPIDIAPAEGSWAERLKVATQNIVKLTTDAWARGDYITKDPLAVSIDSANQALLQDWYDILDNSAEGTADAELDKFSDRYHPVNVDLYDCMKSVMRGDSEDFFHTIAAACENFQLIYIPAALDGSSSTGQLARMENILNDAQDITIQESGIDINAGSPRIMPVTHVIMKTLVIVDGHFAQSYTLPDGGQAVSVSVAAFPDDSFTGGSILTVTAPPWIRQKLGITEVNPDSIKAEDGGGLKINEYVVDAAGYLTLANKISDEVGGLAQSWLKQFYIDTALASSQVTLTLPLDLQSWQPGRFYNVSSDGNSKEGSGGVLFSGLLNAVSHNVTSRGGATTTIAFTHTQIGSFKLRGI
jgi:hypothetical protein